MVASILIFRPNIFRNDRLVNSQCGLATRASAVAQAPAVVKTKIFPGLGRLRLQSKKRRALFYKYFMAFRDYKIFRFDYILPQYQSGVLHLTIYRRNLFISILDEERLVIYSTSLGVFLKQIGSGKTMTKLTLAYRAKSVAKKLVALKKLRLEFVVNRASGRHSLIKYFFDTLLEALPPRRRLEFYITRVLVISKLKYNGTRGVRLSRKSRTYRPKVRRYFFSYLKARDADNDITADVSFRTKAIKATKTVKFIKK